MKSLLTSILVVATVMMSSFAQPSTIDDVIGAIRSGDADELSKYFDDNIELTLPVKSDSYSKAQAQVILKKVEELTATYPDADLRWWADRIREWDLAGHDVFVYFNNDGNAHAVRNARTLRALPVSGAASHPAAHAVNTD